MSTSCGERFAASHNPAATRFYSYYVEMIQVQKGVSPLIDLAVIILVLILLIVSLLFIYRGFTSQRTSSAMLLWLGFGLLAAILLFVVFGALMWGAVQQHEMGH
ncbi:hypothetical protein SAMN06295960_0747 [Paenibacillus aquistagni]|uniref:Uncharacterized protein n=1 Tax=Paenibacillus aquistagni TaxID=1852522 RepID=A0A1X7IT13_9BACL|nr:hypothetical protein SAMN06295960_0747 [Paenibacillus aquistagni]